MPIDSDSLGRLLDEYWAILVEWVGGAQDGAEDVVQSAFVRLACEDPPPANCAAWLFVVSKRLAINERVSRTKRRMRESRGGGRTAAQDDASIGLEMRELLGTLDSREREVIVARIWGGLTFDQIGAAFGESKATTWRTYQSGITKLKEAYGEVPYER